MAAHRSEKKTILGVKLDRDTREIIERRCVERGCNVSDYVRGLIKRDMDSETIESRNDEIPREIVKGTLRTVSQEEARKYPKARPVHTLDRDGNLVHTDHYDENGKLWYTEYPPTSPGGKPTYVIH